MAYDQQLAQRIRETLAGHEVEVREVKMFGGLSFMVNGKLAISANTHGDLMVRCDPDRVDELLHRPGAAWAEMRGKPMSRGWLCISNDAVSSDGISSDGGSSDGIEDSAGLEFWVAAALDNNRSVAGEL